MKKFILVSILILAIYSLKYANVNSHSKTITTHYGNPNPRGPPPPPDTPNITSTNSTQPTNDTAKPADPANSTDDKPTDP